MQFEERVDGYYRSIILQTSEWVNLIYNTHMSAKKSILMNENQQKAVNHKAGPLLVVAGAGTGKTRTLVERMGWSWMSGISTPATAEPKAIVATMVSKPA